MFRLIFHISRPMHKYMGLVFCLYFILMGITGILINHPALISGLSLSALFIPDTHRYDNWNRMALRKGIVSGCSPDTVYMAGKCGVWKSNDRGKNFIKLTNGLPQSVYREDTRALLLIEEKQKEMLLAGTRAGLFYLRPGDDHWKTVSHPELRNQEIVDIVHAGKRLFVFTRHSGYMSDIRLGAPEFTRINLATFEPQPEKMAFFRLLLKIHDGSLLGLPGRLFADCMGAGLVFLSISACYIWFVPAGKRKLKFARKPRFFRFFHAYHLLIGISTAFFLALIALSSILVRPPFLQAIIKETVPVPHHLSHNRAGDWRHGRIQKALYLEPGNQLLLATSGGFFVGPAGLHPTLEKIAAPVPIHGMGAFVLESMDKDKILIGSFKGAYVWNMTTGELDVPTRLLPDLGGVKKTFVNGYRISGVITRNNRPLSLIDYRRGLLAPGASLTPYTMPSTIKKYPMSLFHFLFACHNGRIFRGLLGGFTWLVIPVGGLALLMTIATGCYDWIFQKAIRRF